MQSFVNTHVFSIVVVVLHAIFMVVNMIPFFTVTMVLVPAASVPYATAHHSDQGSSLHPVKLITEISSSSSSSLFPKPIVTMIPSDPLRAGSNVASVMQLQAIMSLQSEREVKKNVIRMRIAESHPRMRLVSGKRRTKRQIDAIPGSGTSSPSSSSSLIQETTPTTRTAAAAAVLPTPSASGNHGVQSLPLSSRTTTRTTMLNDMNDDVRLKRDGKCMSIYPAASLFILFSITGI